MSSPNSETARNHSINSEEKNGKNTNGGNNAVDGIDGIDGIDSSLELSHLTDVVHRCVHTCLDMVNKLDNFEGAFKIEKLKFSNCVTILVVIIVIVIFIVKNYFY